MYKVFSNMSAVYVMMDKANEALEYADKCISKKSDFYRVCGMCVCVGVWVCDVEV